MHWLLYHAGVYGGPWYNFLSSAGGDSCLLIIAAVLGRIAARHREHARSSEAQRRTLAALYQHMTGRQPPGGGEADDSDRRAGGTA